MPRSPAAAIRWPRTASRPSPQDERNFASWFAGTRTLDSRRDRAPMLDLLYAAANKGTGKRAAMSVPTFGKTGTTQENRDALFIGFAGDLVVGVWVGRDDNGSLGKISGGTVPARIWRKFMVSALAVDRRRGPDLPAEFKAPSNKRVPPPKPQQSPLPPEWSDATKALREVAEEIGEMFDDK